MRPLTESTETLTPVGGLMARLIALRQNKEIGRFLKFAVVGTMGAVIDGATFNVLLAQSWLAPIRIQLRSDLALNQVVIAGAVAFVLAVLSNFIWNRYWTYPDSRSKPLVAQFVTFFGINAFGLAIRALILQFGTQPLANGVNGILPTLRADLAHRIGANVAWALAVIVVMFWNFFVNRYLTYNDVK